MITEINVFTEDWQQFDGVRIHQKLPTGVPNRQLQDDPEWDRLVAENKQE